MSHAFRGKTLVAGLGLLLVYAAAPVALADPPGYYFKDDPLPSAGASVSATGTAIEAQVAAVNRKADQALATAQQALQEAHQASREPSPSDGASTKERSRPIVDGHHLQPRRDDVCNLSHRAPDCRDGGANGVDQPLLREILGRATP